MHKGWDTHGGNRARSAWEGALFHLFPAPVPGELDKHVTLSHDSCLELLSGQVRCGEQSHLPHVPPVPAMLAWGQACVAGGSLPPDSCFQELQLRDTFVLRTRSQGQGGMDCSPLSYRPRLPPCRLVPACWRVLCGREVFPSRIPSVREVFNSHLPLSSKMP